jgi:hypothetical protein
MYVSVTVAGGIVMTGFYFFLGGDGSSVLQNLIKLWVLLLIQGAKGETMFA